jgi:lipopolysaccharide transport system permease protein
MRQFSISPVEMFASLWCNRGLVPASARREVLGRYRGSANGLLGSFYNPLLMLTTSTFVFRELFKARQNVGSESKKEFAHALFASLVVFGRFAECIKRAPGLIFARVIYANTIDFRPATLPSVAALSTLFHAAINLSVWLLAHTALFGIPQATILHLPLLIVVFLYPIMGIDCELTRWTSICATYCSSSVT